MKIYADTTVYAECYAESIEELERLRLTLRTKGWNVSRWEFTYNQWDALMEEVYTRYDMHVASATTGHLLGAPFHNRGVGRAVLREEVTEIA